MSDKCPACGRENRPQATYCAGCGAQLVAPAAAAKPVQAEASSAGQALPQVSQAAPSGASSEQSASASLSKAQTAPVSETEAVEPTQPGPGAAVQAGPLRPGDHIGDRYEVVEVLESSPEQNRYRALDLKRCSSCGYADNASNDEYCHECGVALKASSVSIVEHVRRPPETFDTHLRDGERDYYVTIEAAAPSTTQPAATARGRLRLVWGRSTDKGQQRELNEDCLEVWLYARGSGGVLGLFVVADGLGGQDSGEVASRLATDTIWQSLRSGVWEPVLRGESIAADTVEARLLAAVIEANRAVYDERTARKSEMSSTVTLALVLDDTAYIANVGDSRTYLWNAAGLVRITRDHSLVQRLVDTGQIAAADVYVHPQRNLIYESIGDRSELQPDVYRRGLAPDDHLILCSDGLWEMVRDEGIEEVLLSEPDPQRACDRLVHNANLAGGEDNISVIIVQAMQA